MPSPRLCEQCLRPTPDTSHCPRHPYARHLHLDDPADHQHYRALLQLRRGRWLPRAMLSAYTLLTVGGSLLMWGLGLNVGPIYSFLLINLALLLLVLPLLPMGWLLGVLSRDLWLGYRRWRWGIDVEEVPTLLTDPVHDPDPMRSAADARHIREVRKAARTPTTGSRLIR